MTLSICCGAATRYNPDPQSTSGLLCVKCGLNCCGEKPMKHTVKIGDRFKLGPWEWRVKELRFASFIAESEANLRMITLYDEDASSLDWIKPEPTCSKEFAEAMKENLGWRDMPRKTYEILVRFLDSHIEEKG